MTGLTRNRAFRPGTSLVIVALVPALLTITGVQAALAVAATPPCDSMAPVEAEDSTFSRAEDGELWAWGSNYWGQLGNGESRTNELSPIPVPGPDGSIKMLSTGFTHTLALMMDGTVWAWGGNTVGELGDGTTIERSHPEPVEGLTDVVSITAGGWSSFAIKEDGTVWAWGRNDFGQLGDGTFTNRLTPTQIEALTGVTQIEIGYLHTLALRPDGRVWSFGNGGALGRGDDPSGEYPIPGLVRTSSDPNSYLTNIVDIGASDHSIALKSDGTVRAWGDGVRGQLGNGAFSDEPYPVVVKGPDGVGTLTGITNVSVGGYFTLAERTDNTLWGWGQNYYYELGNPEARTYQSTPVAVVGADDVVTMDAGGNHSILLREDGTTSTWGANFDGEIGDGTTNHRATPYTTSVTQAVPDVPTELEAVAGEELAFLTWEAPESVVTQYVITPYHDGVAQPEVTVPPGETEYAVTGLVESESYEFTVAAQNCLGSSDESPRTDPVIPTGVQLDDHGFSVEGVQVTDRMDLRVNLFNGNLSLSASDLHIAGTGLDVSVDRVFRSRAEDTSVFGNKWVTNLGSDVRLEPLTDGSVFLHTSGGGQVGFAVRADGSYITPAGVDADLVQHPDGTWTLSQHYSGETMDFDAAGRLVEHADRNGNTISYSYVDGVLASVTDTQGRTLTLTTNASGQVTRMVDVAGREWIYAYQGGNLTTYTDPAGGITRFAYDSLDRIVKITSPEGRVVEVTYTDMGHVESLGWPLAADSPTTTFTYESGATEVTDANGHTTTYTFDPVGRTIGVNDALGNDTDTEYTSDSNVDRHRSARGGTTTFAYDAATNPAGVQVPTSAAWEMDYTDPDHPHLPTRMRDPQNNLFQVAYDDAGNPTQLTDGLSEQNEVELVYNPDGTVASSTDATGATTTYTYDAAGNPTGMSPPSPLGSTGVGHDVLSRVTSTTDGNGQTTRYSYDALDRITEVLYEDGTTVTYGWDGDGNLTSTTDTTGTTTMVHDATNRLVSRITPDGVEVTYGYDPVGNLTSVTGPTGTVTYGYNPVNLPTTVTHPNGTTSTMGYDANYNRTSLTHPNGVSLTTVYDDSDRVSKMSWIREGDTLESFDYSWTRPTSGNPDTTLRYRVTDLDGNVTRYGYDALNRLVQARTTDAGGSLLTEVSYTYDGHGNRTSRTRFDGTLSITDQYTYNSAGQLVEVNGETLSYDANGNLTGTSTGAELVYNAADQTISIRPRADQGVAAEYGYRGAGQAERATATPASTSAEPLCAPLTGCLDSPSFEVSTSRYTHTLLGVGAETVVEDTTATTTGFVRDPSGRLLGAHTTDQQWFYLTDALGTVVGVTGQDGTTLAAYRYDPFGQTTQATGPVAEVNRWRFAGAYLDATGLYKIGARYYHPGWGRWTQPDPILAPLDPVNWNRYAYAGNNPVNYTDPSGLKTFWEWAGCMATNYFGIGWEENSGSGGGAGGGGLPYRISTDLDSGVTYGAGKVWSFAAKRVFKVAAPRLARYVPYVGAVFTVRGVYDAWNECR